MKIENAKIRGFYAGLIAGAIGGLVYILCTIPESMLGLPGVLVETLDIFEFNTFIYLLGYSIPANGIWGSIYGIIFSIFYDRVPGKGVRKGYVWGCIIAFISNLWLALGELILFLLTRVERYAIGVYSWAETGLVIWVTYGIFFGILYERWK